MKVVEIRGGRQPCFTWSVKDFGIFFILPANGKEEEAWAREVFKDEQQHIPFISIPLILTQSFGLTTLKGNRNIIWACAQQKENTKDDVDWKLKGNGQARALGGLLKLEKCVPGLRERGRRVGGGNQWGGCCISGFKRQESVIPEHQRCFWNKKEQTLEEEKKNKW